MRKLSLGSLAAILCVLTLASLPASAEQELLAYNGLTGQFEPLTPATLDMSFSDFELEAGPCCNCACGFIGCNISFQGRDCGTTPNNCNTSSC